MTRALDGSYWLVEWDYKGMDDQEFATESEADLAIEREARRVHCAHGNHNEGRKEHVLPELSIVEAVRLLTEARAKGVKLWMRPVDGGWWRLFDSVGSLSIYTGPSWEDPNITEKEILTKWIVATPQDARKIDARGKT